MQMRAELSVFSGMARFSASGQGACCFVWGFIRPFKPVC